MTQQEYENQKRESWKEFQNTIFNNPIPISPYTAFSNAFDHAFALGKQEKDADTVIQGWVAIDEAFDQCFLHTEKPI